MALEELRQRIDTVNHEMIKLLIERMDISMEIAKYKHEHGIRIYDKNRERKIISEMLELVDEKYEGYTEVFFKTLMELSKAYQNCVISQGGRMSERIDAALRSTPTFFPNRVVVACQGVEGAYSQMACDKLFRYADIHYYQRWDDVFQAVEDGTCKYGILPIENSSYGSVAGVYDLMKQHSFYIARSIKMRISHTLLANKDADIRNIKEIYSHEQAIGQCSKFLSFNPDIQIHVCANTAVAAKMVAESGRNDVAAISSKNCAELYGLKTLLEDVQNSDNNYTRFICISKNLEIYPGASRISVMMTLPHRPGSLSDMLSRFSMMGMNLTKLESRPIPGRDFEFMFYFDFEASVLSPVVLNMLDSLCDTTETFVFLGNYTEV